MKSQMVRSLVAGYMTSLELAGVVECSPSSVVDHVRNELGTLGREDLISSVLPMIVANHVRKYHWNWKRIDIRGDNRRVVLRRDHFEPMVIELSRDEIATLMFFAELVTMGSDQSKGVSEESVEMVWKLHERLQKLFLAMTGVDTRDKLEI